jgi:hypothetical protein
MPSLPSPDLDPILYFYTNSLAAITSAAVLFFSLGVLFGWLTWARFKRRARAFQEETDLLRHEIARLKRHIATEVVNHQTHPHETPIHAIAEPATKIEKPKAESIAQTEKPEIVATERSLPVVESRKESLAEAVLRHVGSNSLAIEPSAPPDELVSPAAPVTATTSPVVATAPAVLAHEPEVAKVKPTAPIEPVTKPTVAAPVVTIEPIPSIPSISATEAAFASELKSGCVRYDPEVGILYLTKPERSDDLTLLRGVAEAVQERLHEQGIYTFKQIATWTEHHIEQVSTRLHLNGRPQRDHWMQQSRNLHYLKYGEKVD